MITIHKKPAWSVLTLVLALACAYNTLTLGQASAAEAKPFGITKFSMQTIKGTREIENGLGGVLFENEPEPFIQAGGHPWGWTVDIEFAHEEVESAKPTKERLVFPTRDPKDVSVDLPPGWLGNPTATPRCPLNVALSTSGVCPSSTQIGEAVVRYFGGDKSARGPILNLVPEAGQSAEFGLKLNNIIFLLTGHVVHTQSGYGLTGVTNDLPITELVRSELTFWGVPADPSHDAQRGLTCERAAGVQEENFSFEGCSGGGLSSGEPLTPFWTMPANCTAGPETAAVRADSWEEPGRYVQASSTLPAMTGCNLLQFNPSIEVQPDTLTADEPVGLGVNLQVPQIEKPQAAATPQLRDAVVTLPEGMSISPGIVDGIQACDESGRDGINFTGPESEEEGLNGELQLAPGHCPDASTVGTAEAITPLLSNPVKGHIYLARPGCGGGGQSACTEEDALDGNLYRLYLELGGVGELANAGVNIKVEGRVEANPVTGQLTTVFDNNPQLPFSELKIRLNGGPRAPLDTPVACGPATTTADFTPWSAPGTTPEGDFEPGTPDATPASTFEVGGCGDGPSLSPGFLAGTVTPQAGRFSPFTLTLTRKDREQDLSGIQVHTPLGLLGMLSSVPLCGEPQAAQGTCAASSQIGSTTVASGAGSHPFEIGGSVYLTTGYKGAPFGLSIVTNVVAGPFHLGLVVVRARIDVNPETSALTVTSDPLPQIVFGVPLRLQRITVDIDRPNFMFNPTSCKAQQVSATVSGEQNAVANVSSPFAAAGCKSLAFKPQFKVSTKGRTNRVQGASLDAKVSYPSGSIGSEANIAKVKVSLPKILPSRLSTLQKACPAETFETDPAGCPKGSIVGIVRASTPVLPVGLAGPVYFVSHGGEEFPSLIVVLQGDGVRVDLTGTTFINSKTNVTSSTFKTVPDVPVNNFELYLPQGKDSALAANGNLCKSKSKLVMPTIFIAQNGAELKENTKIEVTGCPRPRAARTPKGGAKRAGNNARRSSNNRRMPS